MSLEEPTTVIVSVKTGTIVSQTNSISTTMSTSSMTFNNLVSDSLYTITVEGSNCAGRSSATIDMWTLPSPPQNIHAYHVVSTPSTVHLQETWTPVGGNNKLTYVMRVSSKDDLILNQVPVSSDHCDTTMCQFTIDFNATDTSVFFISIATISESRIGPHSDEVKSVLEVGTNKKMKGDLLELNTNTTYGSPTVQEVGNNKLTYVMRVSSKDDLILNQVPVSSDHCDTTMCQFTIDFNATDTSVFFISIATISDSRIGPHSDEVKSVLVPTLCTVDEHVNPRIALRNLGILTLTRKGYKVGPQLILIKSDCLQIISQRSMISEGYGKWATIRDSFLFLHRNMMNCQPTILNTALQMAVNPRRLFCQLSTESGR
ncbi:hypothetical protein EMCRGX_G015480 [Ephydatia muelleri]